MKIKYYILPLVAIMFLGGCRKEFPEINSPEVKPTVNNWVDVFDYFWETTSSSYLFWDVTELDWDEVRLEYRPKFEALELNTIKGDSLAVVYFSEMTESFVDNHYVLAVNGSHIIDPSMARNKKREGYYPRYDRSILYKVLSEDMKSRVDSMKYYSSPSPKFEVYSALIDGSVAYCSLSNFVISDKISDEELNAVLQNFYDIVGKTVGLKGIIIDVRNNGGGYCIDENFILAPLIKEPLVICYQRIKNSPSRMDYTPWVPVLLRPYNPVNYDHNIPIISLADLYSVSMSEVTTMAVKSLPNGLFVGERTWGAHGAIAGDSDPFYSGNFTLEPYLDIYCATYSTRPTFDGILEGVGVTPDIEVRWNQEKIDQGVDVQLERALEYIKVGL